MQTLRIMFVFFLGVFAPLRGTPSNLAPRRKDAKNRQGQRVIIGWLLLTIASCSKAITGGAVVTPTSPAIKPTTPLVVSPDYVDFGAVTQGGRHESEVSIHNPGVEPIEIVSIKSSCECFQIKLPSDFVEPGQKIKATVAIDLTDDQKFTGKLGLEASGVGKSMSGPAFIIRADVVVKPKP